MLVVIRDEVHNVLVVLVTEDSKASCFTQEDLPHPPSDSGCQSHTELSAWSVASYGPVFHILPLITFLYLVTKLKKKLNPMTTAVTVIRNLHHNIVSEDNGKSPHFFPWHLIDKLPLTGRPMAHHDDPIRALHSSLLQRGIVSWSTKDITKLLSRYKFPITTKPAILVISMSFLTVMHKETFKAMLGV